LNKTVVPQEFQFLFSLQFPNSFEQVGESWRLLFKCKFCNEIVNQWDRESHFHAHKNQRAMFVEASRVAASLARDTGNGEIRTDVCVNCGNTFQQERKRGRPRKKCYECLPEKG